ncbi:MAG TPA: betaine/proline/choline family ABC transporter ATP-binding protein [Mycobacteriales bacterium]|nr:betaine/proline/choline family ABC transporter ATP-binding protein [Mycobacteriales bacterium]
MKSSAPPAPTDDDPMISIENLHKQYADGTVAVQDLSLEVGVGEIAVLVGPSGCGKTTTMRMINRLVEPTSGRILVEGRDVMSGDPVKLRRRIGYVIQQVGLFPHQSVAANIATVPQLLGWDRARTAARVTELMELVGLDPDKHAKRYPHELSGGQRQRVGVARALAADPPVLLMDEPFGAVDPVARDRLQVEFLRLQEQVRKTIVFVTHDIDEAIRLGDRIAVMREGGHLEQYADPSTLLSHPATDFVADFVGAERTLRRLSVVQVSTTGLVQWPVIAPADRLADCATVMDKAESSWAVVGNDSEVSGWLARSDAAGEGSAADRLQPAAAVPTGASLEAALATILAGNAPGAIVTDGGRYAGVLSAADIVTVARSRG